MLFSKSKSTEDLILETLKTDNMSVLGLHKILERKVTIQSIY